MSQMGAFIRTEAWSFFQVNDEVIVTCFLPPDFSGQDEFTGLQGEATIWRIDPVNKCVAVEFMMRFKQFEQIPKVESEKGREHRIKKKKTINRRRAQTKFQTAENAESAEKVLFITTKNTKGTKKSR